MEEKSVSLSFINDLVEKVYGMSPTQVIVGTPDETPTRIQVLDSQPVSLQRPQLNTENKAVLSVIHIVQFISIYHTSFSLSIRSRLFVDPDLLVLSLNSR